ncbi:MAG: ribosome assembly factor SBDS [Candidatus Thermoplasmatota archaeon]|nr:ribosome assembly factor SBDS [Candidatus Thermoplasmatota archaeon]
MVSLDDAVIARLKKGEHHFEILVDPYGAADIIEGKETEVLQIMAIDDIFSDAKKGIHVSEEALEDQFETTDVSKIAEYIIKHGDIQLTTDQRHKMQKNKQKRVVEHITKNAMDPQTKTPHPRNRIERAMEEAGVHIDPFKPVSEQVKSTVNAIRPYIPLSMERVKITVKIPAKHVGKAYGVARSFGVLEQEDWQSDGSWVGVVRLAAGMQDKFYDKLNEVTKGNVSTKVLK